MEEWLLMQSFYHGLTQKSHEQLDATAEGSFMSLTLRKLKFLWKGEPLIKAGHHVTFNYAIRAKKYQKRYMHCQPRWMYC
jgi:hypothetical protein